MYRFIVLYSFNDPEDKSRWTPTCLDVLFKTCAEAEKHAAIMESIPEVYRDIKVRVAMGENDA